MESDQSVGDESAPRLKFKYGREQLLTIKQCVTDQEANGSKTPLCSSTIDCRKYNRRSKLPFSRTQANEKVRDSDGIVLGPQKRTWNTGCHVSQQPTRGVHEVSHSTRGAKFTAEYRPLDRSYGRGNSEAKRESRGGIDFRLSNVRSRDRGGVRSDGSFFARSYPHSRDDYGGRTGRSSDHALHKEAEPEWFSEGPTTVNDTIELGGMMDETDNDDSASSQKKSCTTREVKALCKPDETFEDTSSVRVCKSGQSYEQTQDQDHTHKPSVKSNRDEKDNATAALPPEFDLLQNLEIPKNDIQGSRFRHLFTKEEATIEKNEGDINAQLLKLLKGAPTPGPKADTNTPNVSQVEETLRSLLLGRPFQPGSDTCASKPVSNHGSKPQVLTVEEIEAQMNLPRGDTIITTPPKYGTSRFSSFNELQTTTAIPMSTHSPVMSFAGPANTSNSVSTIPQLPTNKQAGGATNLVPILQNLLVKQQQQTTTQPFHPNTPLNPFGVFNNSILRLPSTNAVSASARINQLQQPDLNVHTALNDSASPVQGMANQAYECISNTIGTTLTPRALVHTSSTNSVSSPSRYAAACDLSPRCAFPPNLNRPPPAALGSVGPVGRPIVKMQQCGTNPLSSPSFSGLISLGSSPCGISGSNMKIMSSPIQRDVDRRLLAQLAPKHPYLARNGTPASLSGEVSGPNHCRTACFRSSGGMASQSSTLLSTSASNNSNANISDFFSTTSNNMPVVPDGGDPLVFLSRLARLEKTRLPPGFQNIPNTYASFKCGGIEPKTLEELERP